MKHRLILICLHPALCTLLVKEKFMIKSTGNEKGHFTVVLACLADGSKLKPMIWPCQRRICQLGDLCIFMKRVGWTKKECFCRSRRCVRKGMPGVPHVQNSPNGFHQEELSEGNTDVTVIPGGLTSQLQPLDVSINKPFKDQVRVLWTEWTADHAHKEASSRNPLLQCSVSG